MKWFGSYLMWKSTKTPSQIGFIIQFALGLSNNINSNWNGKFNSALVFFFHSSFSILYVLAFFQSNNNYINWNMIFHFICIGQATEAAFQCRVSKAKSFKLKLGIAVKIQYFQNLASLRKLHQILIIICRR